MRIPLLTTFIATVDQLKKALEAGADRLIIEDSKLSVRSYSDDFSLLHFDKAVTLAEQAREIRSDIELCFNCDVMIHLKHTPLLKAMRDSLRKAKISTVRIQDPGLIGWFKQHAPEFVIHLATETGNNNHESLRFFKRQGVFQQTFTNEMTYEGMKEVMLKVEGPWELQVQGPLLIQYTYRRLMVGQIAASDDDPDTLAPVMYKVAYDTTRDGRPFPFYDNPHGHFMYFWADRCLLKYMPQLMDLQLDSWLIDARGKSLDYMVAALEVYRYEAEALMRLGQDIYRMRPLSLSKLQDTAQRPFKAGFFLANRTDYVKRRGVALRGGKVLARVVDVVKGKCVVVEVRSLLQQGTKALYRTPENRECLVDIQEIKLLNETQVGCVEAGELVKLPWTPRVVPQSLLLERE